MDKWTLIFCREAWTDEYQEIVRYEDRTFIPRLDDSIVIDSDLFFVGAIRLNYVSLIAEITVIFME